MAKLGCLLIIVSVAALIAVIVIPVLPPAEENATIDQYLQPLPCEPGETVLREQYSQSTFDGTGYSMTVSCVDNEGQERDVTDRWGIIGILSFVAPFALAMLLMMGAIFRMSTRASRAVMENASSWVTVTPQAQPMSAGSMGTMMGSKEASLTERLQEIQQAHDAGLISEGEYERLRKEVLDKLV